MGALLLAFFAFNAGAAELELTVDPRLELHSLLLTPASSATGCPALDEYRRLALLRYGASTRAAGAYSRHGAAAPVPATVLARLSPPPKLEELRPFPPAAADAFGGRRELEDWLRGLRALGRELDFSSFHAAAAPRLEPGLARVKDELIRLGALEAVERYAGLALNGRLSVMTPAIDPTLALPVMIETDSDGSRSLAWTLAVCPAEDAAAARREAGRAIVSIWHEALHGLLDPLADLHARKLAARSAWDVREHIVQAATLRVLERSRSRLDGLEPAGNSRPGLNPEIMNALRRSLERYESAGGSRTLAEFYPELLAAFPETRPAPAEPHDWLLELVEAFPSDGMRRAAIERIGLALKGGEDRELRLRRAALRWLTGETAGALADARGHALEGVIALDAGEADRGLALLRAAAGTCAEESRFCRDLRWWIAPAPAEPRPEAARPGANPPGDAVCATVADCRRQAIALFGESKLDRALDALDAGARIDPDDTDLLFDRGAIFHELRRYEEALDSYARVLAQTPGRGGLNDRHTRGMALAAQGSVSLARGNAARADKALRGALAAAGDDWPRRSEIQLQLKRIQRLRSAEEAPERALSE